MYMNGDDLYLKLINFYFQPNVKHIQQIGQK